MKFKKKRNNGNTEIACGLYCIDFLSFVIDCCVTVRIVYYVKRPGDLLDRYFLLMMAVREWAWAWAWPRQFCVAGDAIFFVFFLCSFGFKYVNIISGENKVVSSIGNEL